MSRESSTEHDRQRSYIANYEEGIGKTIKTLMNGFEVFYDNTCNRKARESEEDFRARRAEDIRKYKEHNFPKCTTFCSHDACIRKIQKLWQNYGSKTWYSVAISEKIPVASAVHVAAAAPALSDFVDRRAVPPVEVAAAAATPSGFQEQKSDDGWMETRGNRRFEQPRYENPGRGRAHFAAAAAAAPLPVQRNPFDFDE